MEDSLIKRIKDFYKDIDARVKKEKSYIKKTANPQKTRDEYVRNIRWESDKLAEYLLIALNSDD